MTDTLSDVASVQKAYQEKKSERVHRSGRSALVAFALITVGAFVLMLWCEHGTWFQLDDWDFLSVRTAGNLGDLFRAHNEHWSTLPILVYRLLWVGFGIHTARPYQAVVIVGHLAVAALLLTVMRRAGVRPWLAVASGTLLVFFGTGAEDILVAFQLTFVYALLFGLVHVLLADHDGPFDRRDWFGLLAGVASLMCSGIGVVMVVVVGVSTLLRRGWRVAVAHAAPLAAIYVLWKFVAPTEPSLGYYHANSPAGVVRFVAVGFRAAFRGLGQLPGVGVLLAAMLIVGFVLCLRRDARLLRGAPAMVVALLAGALAFLVVTALYRSGTTGAASAGNNFGPEHARISRYVYIVGATVVPSIAFAAELIVRHWRRATILVFALVLVGLPGNIDKLVRYNDINRSPLVTARRPYILRAPRLPLAGQLPRTLPLGSYITLGWIIDSLPSGRVPAAPHATKNDIATETLSLALAPTSGDAAAPCTKIVKPMVRTIQRGQRLTVRAADVEVEYVPSEGVSSSPQTIAPSTVVALAGPLPLRIRATNANGPAPIVCG